MKELALLDIANTVAAGIFRASRCSSAVDARVILRRALREALEAVDSDEEANELDEQQGL